MIFAWLSIKAISKKQNGQKHEQDEAEQQNAGAGSCRGVLCALISLRTILAVKLTIIVVNNS